MRPNAHDLSMLIFVLLVMGCDSSAVEERQETPGRGILIGPYLATDLIWSNQTNEIIFGGDAGIGAVSAAGGDTRRITGDPVQQLSSPDGGSTLYYLVSNGSALVTAPATGGAPELIAEEVCSVSWPRMPSYAVSRTGRFVTYCTDLTADGTASTPLYLLDRLTGERRLIHEGTRPVIISPDEESVVAWVESASQYGIIDFSTGTVQMIHDASITSFCSHAHFLWDADGLVQYDYCRGLRMKSIPTGPERVLAHEAGTGCFGSASIASSQDHIVYWQTNQGCFGGGYDAWYFVRSMNVRTGRIRTVMSFKLGIGFSSLAISPNGTHVARADQSYIWTAPLPK